MSDRNRQLAPGADADAVAMDSDGVIQRVWTLGHKAYQHTPES